jgi:peptide deformylase
MITQNIDTLRNPSLDFMGSAEDLKALISLLEFELKSNPGNGVGLSAIQINIPLRVAVIRAEKTVINLINAKIIKAEQPFTFKGEGCLSFPGEFHNTTRFNIVNILNGDGEEIKLSGFLAVVAQHEMDHWEGAIFRDKVIS